MSTQVWQLCLTFAMSHYDTNKKSEFGNIECFLFKSRKIAKKGSPKRKTEYSFRAYFRYIVATKFRRSQAISIWAKQKNVHTFAVQARPACLSVETA